MIRPASEFGELGIVSLRHAGDHFHGSLINGDDVGLSSADERVIRWQMDGHPVDPDPHPPAGEETAPKKILRAKFANDVAFRAVVRAQMAAESKKRGEVFDDIIATAGADDLNGNGA